RPSAPCSPSGTRCCAIRMPASRTRSRRSAATPSPPPRSRRASPRASASTTSARRSRAVRRWPSWLPPWTPTPSARRASRRRPGRPPRRPPPRRGPAPLTAAQRRLWFLDRFVPDGAVSTNGLVFDLEGTLDIRALQRALRGLVERHEVLRTRYEDTPDGPV